MAIAPNAVHAGQIDLFIWRLRRPATQFTAKTGSPDTATIGVDSGIVKFEFISFVQPDQVNGFTPNAKNYER